MKIYIQAICVVLAIGAASCFVISNAQQNPVQGAETQTQSNVTALLQEFKTGEHRSRQAEIGKKLVALRDKSVVPAMLILLKSPNRLERCNAGRVLAGLGEDRGLFAVIAELQDTGNRLNTDEEALLEGSPKDKAPARQITGDRYYAAHVLGKIGDKRAVPALIATLQDESINYGAAYVLAHLGDQRAVPALLASLERAQVPQKPNSPNTDMRLWAGYGLMWLKHPKGLPTVAQCLEADRHWIQRRHAADALGEFNNKAAVPFLIKALKDTEVEVRVNAITALGRIGDKAAIPALKVLLKDTSRAKGRARIGYQSPMPFFKSMTAREAASYALNQIGAKKSTASTT